MVLYYCRNLERDLLTLSPEESKHCIKVTHHAVGDAVLLTDGKGIMAKAIIAGYDKSGCMVRIEERIEDYGKRDFQFHLAVAPTKNRDRMDWMVEKSVEIGIEKITFIICKHSERQKIDLDRMERIAVAAMKQSLTSYLPEMTMMTFDNFIEAYGNGEGNKLIAWCGGGKEDEELAGANLSADNILLMIGPEGDFTPEEVAKANRCNFKNVKLGPKRLRTETAALYGCSVIASRRL